MAKITKKATEEVSEPVVTSQVKAEDTVVEAVVETKETEVPSIEEIKPTVEEVVETVKETPKETISKFSKDNINKNARYDFGYTWNGMEFDD